MVPELREHGIGFQPLHEASDTTTPGGRLIFQSSPRSPSSAALGLILAGPQFVDDVRLTTR
jgi:hypothetical protein